MNRQFHTAVLSNGLRVAVFPMPQLRSICIGFWVRTGTGYEPPGSNGLAHVLEHMIFKGTGRLPADRAAAVIEGLGGWNTAATGRDRSCFSQAAAASRVDEVVELYGELLSGPAILPQLLDRELTIVEQEIGELLDVPSQLAPIQLAQAVWGDPIGNPILGTVQGVGTVTADLLAELHSRWYVGRNMMVTCAGAVDPDRLCTRLESALGGIPAGAAAVPAAQSTHRRPVTITRAAGAQVHICIGGRIPPFGAPERLAVHAANIIIGRGRRSRLAEALRNRHGLAYRVFSYTEQLGHAGLFGLYLSTAPATVTRALELVGAEFDRLARDGVTEAELAAARRQMEANLVMGLETSNGWMNQMANATMYLAGRHLSIDECISSLDSLSLDDVNGVVSSVLGQEMSAVAVGEVPAEAEPVLGSVTKRHITMHREGW